MSPQHIKIEKLGQIASADIQFGDLTVLVGPQATGKSILLQLIKLLLDAGPTLAELRRFNIDWSGKIQNFLELYFGQGMSSIYDPDRTRIVMDNAAVNLAGLVRSRKKTQERLFFIPAQRVLSLREGLTRPFTDYRSGDPFVVREFSENLHQLVQTEFSGASDLFPKSNRLKKEFRDLLSENIFGGFKLRTDAEKFQRRIVLSKGNTDLPYLVWSAGQREFVPLLLGLYWLMPPARVPRRSKLEWVAIEELEMGLHPNAISTTMLLVMELLARGYSVCLSTHSPHVLDVVWALRTIKEHRGDLQDVIDLFSLPSNDPTKGLADSILKKDFRVYYFQRNGHVANISDLDPGSENAAESGWGGLSEFSGHAGDIVSRVVSRNQQRSLL